MTVLVFVHGCPETAAIWEPLLDSLGRDDVTCLSPPGFGAPLPDGFGATADEYDSWLVAELEAFSDPVDLVGHDLGSTHAIRVATTRPDLVRSWAGDTIGRFHPDYRRHYLALLWQTPGVGEVDLARRFGGSVAERTAALVARGVPADVAARIAPEQNPTMAKAVLAHHRSITALSPPPVVHRPGLAIVATADNTVGTEVQRHSAAAAVGADVEVLEGVGRWWMVQDPHGAAKVLTRFWESLPA
ncbi:MAG: alpha/beta hydrolase [Umezawaea sp.]